MNAGMRSSFVPAVVCLVLAAACAPTPPPETPNEAAADGTAGQTTGDASAKKAGPETIPLSGTLSNDQIQKAVNDGAQNFDACYTLGADKSGKLEGTVTVQATVGPNGTVNDASVSKSTLKNEKVDACVIDAFRRLKFAQPEGGGTVMITYPMKFGGEVVVKKQ